MSVNLCRNFEPQFSRKHIVGWGLEKLMNSTFKENHENPKNSLSELAEFPSNWNRNKKKTFPTTHKKYPSHILLLTWAGSVWVQPKSETRRVSRSSATPIINHKKHSSVKRRTESGKARVHANKNFTAVRVSLPFLCHVKTIVVCLANSTVIYCRQMEGERNWRVDYCKKGWQLHFFTVACDVMSVKCGKQTGFCVISQQQTR